MERKTKVKTSKGQIVELKNDMKNVLTYSLRKFPSPIATVDGKLVKTPKSKLMHVLESRVEDPAIEHIPSNNALILDGMALIQMMKHIPDTFEKLVEIILGRILSLASNSKSTRIDFVCDTYPDISIKNMERSSRADGGSTVVRILGADRPESTTAVQEILVSWKSETC
jgi:hypothetical protein